MKIKRDKAGWREILGILFLGLALFIFLSLFSYTPKDIHFLVSSPNQPPENYVGIFGAWFAFLLFMSVGAASYWIPLLIGGLGATYFFEKPEKSFLIKIPASIVLVISFALILHMQTLISSVSFNASHNITSLGGVIGQKLTEAFLYPFFGIKGSSIAVVTAFTVSFLIITEKRLLLFFQLCLRGLSSIKSGIEFLWQQSILARKKNRTSFPKKGKERYVRPIEEDEEADEEEEQQSFLCNNQKGDGKSGHHGNGTPLDAKKRIQKYFRQFLANHAT